MLTGILSKIKTLFSDISGFLKKLLQGIKPVISEKARNLINRVQRFFYEKFPGTRERIILGCSAIVLILVLIGLVILINKPSGTAPAVSGPERSIIPPEELFLPEEPDFIPGVLIDSQRRSAWTAQDAAQYWQDPLKDGEESWREQIEKSIDEIMESIP